MLNKYDYELLCSIRELPGEGFQEDQIPRFIVHKHMNYLIHLGYLEYGTLVPTGKESQYPNGLRCINVSYSGYQAISVFEKELANERRQNIQFWITALLAGLAIPGVLDSLANFIRAASGH